MGTMTSLKCSLGELFTGNHAWVFELEAPLRFAAAGGAPREIPACLRLSLLAQPCLPPPPLPRSHFPRVELLNGRSGDVVARGRRGPAAELASGRSTNTVAGARRVPAASTHVDEKRRRRRLHRPWPRRRRERGSQRGWSSHDPYM